MSYIYGIFNKDENYFEYIGSTGDFIKRKKQHIKALNSGKHTNKTLQKKWNECLCLCDEHDTEEYFEFVIIKELNTDNTLIKFFVESLYNSYYKPRCNKCIIQQGRNKIILQRCDKDLCRDIIETIKKYY